MNLIGIVNVSDSETHSTHLQNTVLFQFNSSPALNRGPRITGKHSIVLLYNEPELLLRLRKHRGQVHFVVMVQPVSFFFTDDFRQSGLICTQACRHFILKWLLLRLNVDLNLATIVVLNALVTHNFTGAIVT